MTRTMCHFVGDECHPPHPPIAAHTSIPMVAIRCKTCGKERMITASKLKTGAAATNCKACMIKANQISLPKRSHTVSGGTREP
jgi:hypothetical protein